MTEGRSFGAWLRREREARGIALRAIADRTKIGPGLLEALERGDISRWPGGIYRRAFVRAYADAVGLEGDGVVAAFERAFPVDPALGVAPAAAVAGATDAPEMRLALATPAVAGMTTSALKTAGRDLACIAAAALVGLAFAGAVGFWCVAALTTIVIHLHRVLGVSLRTRRRETAGGGRAASQPAQVLSFQGKRARSLVRAGRMIVDLSAAATSAAWSGRRRAARS